MTGADQPEVADVRRELQEWIAALWRDHRMLALLLTASLLRLVFHVDSHFTIRDADFFPMDVGVALNTDLRGGRVVPAMLSFLWSVLSGDDPLTAKQVLSKTLLLLALPGFITLALRAGLATRSAAFAALLFLTNAQLFGLYDTLGPYFLLVALVLWQIVFALDVRDGRRGALIRYGLITVLALLCHRNALVTTGLTLGVVFFRSRRRILSAGSLLLLSGVIALAAFKIALALRFDTMASLHHARTYEESLLASLDWNPPDTLESAASGVASLIPGWLGLSCSWIVFLAPCTVVGFAAALLGAREVRRELRWIALLGFGAAAGQAVISEILTADLFFQPSHGVYGFVWMPLLILLLSVAMADRLPERVGAAVLVALVCVNLWQGYGFRTEAFDYTGYEEFVDSQPETPGIHRRLVPAFILNEYARRLSDEAHIRTKVHDETHHNDFTTFDGPEFNIDVITYDELGAPLYRYREYLVQLRSWTEGNDLVLKCRQRRTFASCEVRRAGYDD